MTKEKTLKKKGTGVLAEFKKFISKGNVLDMAVGVIMGSAFGAIVTAFTNILLSLCTWGVPGGLSGLVTVLPAANAGQKVPEGITVGGEALKQFYSATEWAALSQESDFTTTISGMYTNHGGTYYYNKMAIIDWGAFINAIISFLIIAITLFAIVKIFSAMKQRRLALIEKYKLNGEEPAEEKPAAPVKSAEVLLLEEIRDELKKNNELKADKSTTEKA